MQKIYTRRQIISKIATDLNHKQTAVRQIIRALEGQIIALGLERKQVRIAGFGIFYVKMRQSTAIRQIKSNKRQLVLPIKVVKFIAAEGFKKTIKEADGKSPPPPPAHFAKAPATAEPSPSYHIPLQKFSCFERVSKERFNEILRQRLNRTPPARHAPPKQFLDDWPDGRLILSLFKLARNEGSNKLNFVFADDLTYIFTGRPRKLLGKLPRDLGLKFFIRQFDLDDFTIPQERVGLLEYKQKNRGIIAVKVYSLPTRGGASVVVDFKFK